MRRLYVRQRPEGEALEPGPDTVLLFIKLYDPVRSTLRYMGSVLMHEDDTLTHLVPYARRICGLPQTCQVDIREEFKNR